MHVLHTNSRKVVAKVAKRCEGWFCQSERASPKPFPTVEINGFALQKGYLRAWSTSCSTKRPQPFKLSTVMYSSHEW